jgi:hypothetical protein
MTKSDFTWTFPCYILAHSDETEEAVGGAPLETPMRIFAPEVAGDGVKHVAIFTDRDLAESFQQQVPAVADLQLVEFATPVRLKAFLDTVQNHFRYAAIDLNPETRVCRSFLLVEMMPALDRWITDSEGQ